MALRLDPANRSGRKIRADARRQLEEIASLLEDRPQGLHEAVHDARKGFKRLRALYRLVAFDDREFRARENERLRDAANGLAGAREAAAFVETARWLAASARTPEETALIERAVAALEARRDALAAAENLEEPVRAAIAACREAAAAMESLVLPCDRRKAARLIGRSWRRMLKRGRRVLSPLTADSAPEEFHELRKCAQIAWIWHGLLNDLWPAAMLARRNEAKQLVDLLGRENDLAGLVALMEAEPGLFGEAIEQVVLGRIIARKRAALRLSALQQAAVVFAPEPEEDARRIEALWLEAAG